MSDAKIVCTSSGLVRVYTQQEEKNHWMVITAIYVYMGEKNGEEETSYPKYAIIADAEKKVIRAGFCFYDKQTFNKAVQIKVKDGDVYKKMEEFLKRLMKNFTYFEVQMAQKAGDYDYNFEKWPKVKEREIFISS